MINKTIKKQFSIFLKNLNKQLKLNTKFNHINKFSYNFSTQRKFFSTTQDNKEKIVEINETPEIIQTNKEQMGFKAETKKILEIVTHSLYTDKEIFLRELLSNCSDALEKQRFMEVTGKLPMTGEPLYVSINTNEKTRTITIYDSGVGMTRQEMIDNLGTIARSGTQNFLKTIQESKESKGNESLIGQFGVGFYSSFIVGEYVEVISKPQNNEKAYCWISDGNGEFTISDVENCDFKRGTKVVIHLKPDCRDFVKPAELQKIIKKYSNFISYSIKLNGEIVNNLQAIWYRDRKDVTEEEYQKFFEVVSNNTKVPFKYLLHFSSDVPLEIKALLYFPGASFEKYGVQEENTGLALYSKKILIKQKCTELLPNYLRFVKGVVDCSDIPLSISRENYQDSSLIFKLKTLITKRIIKKLDDESNKDPENYAKWYDDFSNYLKEGIVSDTDNAESLMKLLRFKGSFSPNRIGVEDYIKNMKQGQDKIYFLVSNEQKDIENNIYYEAYKGTDTPIIFTQVHFDEVIFKQIGSYKNYKFLNIESESDDFLTKHKRAAEPKETKKSVPDDDITAYTLWIRNELENSVTKVVVSKRLTDSPCIVTSPVSASMKSMMMMFQQQEMDNLNKDLTFEINPDHEIIININKLRKEDPKLASLSVKQLFDSALFQANLPVNNKDYVRRTHNLVKACLELKFNEYKSVGEPKIERLTTEALKEAKDSNKKKGGDMFAEFKLGKDGKLDPTPNNKI
jgi:TNF receptor-associated protein 1